MSGTFGTDQPGQRLEAKGPWPFITHLRLRRVGHADKVWQSRHHRKNLAALSHHRAGAAKRGIRSLNTWISVLFALGALLFMTGSLLTLWPKLAALLSLDGMAIDKVFFAGSIPFTSAAYLQFHQVEHAPLPESLTDTKGQSLFGGRLKNIGWLSCALQLGGTLLFNANTFDAMVVVLNSEHFNLAVWGPDILGSVLFLASGYLAYIEVGHRHLSWRPTEVSWWVTTINLLGCIAFMVSAVFAFAPVQPMGFDASWISVFFTLLGATGFFVGALLMLPEAAE